MTDRLHTMTEPSNPTPSDINPSLVKTVTDDSGAQLVVTWPNDEYASVKLIATDGTQDVVLHLTADDAFKLSTWIHAAAFTVALAEGREITP